MTDQTAHKVAIIARQEMAVTEIDGDSTTEFVAAAFSTTSLKKPVIIGCMYRLTDNSEYCQKLCRAMSDLHTKYKVKILWLVGDANLPDVQWASDSITGHPYSVPINQTFIDAIIDMSCEH